MMLGHFYPPRIIFSSPSRRLRISAALLVSAGPGCVASGRPRTFSSCQNHTPLGRRAKKRAPHSTSLCSLSDFLHLFFKRAEPGDFPRRGDDARRASGLIQPDNASAPLMFVSSSTRQGKAGFFLLNQYLACLQGAVRVTERENHFILPRNSPLRCR